MHSYLNISAKAANSVASDLAFTYGLMGSLCMSAGKNYSIGDGSRCTDDRRYTHGFKYIASLGVVGEMTSVSSNLDRAP